MKMVLNFDVESMIAAVENADYYDQEYRHLREKQPHGSYEATRKWKANMDYLYNQMQQAEEGIWAIIGVLHMDKDAQRRMRIATRAKRKWEEKTLYMRCVPGIMKRQLANFIFGDEGCCVHKAFWDDNSYIKDEVRWY